MRGRLSVIFPHDLAHVSETFFHHLARAPVEVFLSSCCKLLSGVIPPFRFYQSFRHGRLQHFFDILLLLGSWVLGGTLELRTGLPNCTVFIMSN
jgi:hypothetical protein